MTAIVITAMILSAIWGAINFLAAYDKRHLLWYGFARLSGWFPVPFLIFIFSAVWLIWG